MSQNRDFFQRDRNWHPPAFTPTYKSSVTRAPQKALISLPQSISERTGPVFTHGDIDPGDNDLLTNYAQDGGIRVFPVSIVSIRSQRRYKIGLFNFWKKSGKTVADEPTAEALNKEVADLGLDARGLDITVEGDKVMIKGDAVSKEIREKVILAVGNVAGVSEVEDDDADDAVFHTV